MLDLGFMGESTNIILLSSVMSFAWGLRLIPLVGNFLLSFHSLLLCFISVWILCDIWLQRSSNAVF